MHVTCVRLLTSLRASSMAKWTWSLDRWTPHPPGRPDSQVLIRTVLELARWAPSLRGAAGSLKATFENVKSRIWEENPATRCLANCNNLMLPAGLGSRFKLTPWRSDPAQPRPASCDQMSEATEARILESLASDLAGYFQIQVGLQGAHDRAIPEKVPGSNSGYKILVVGASNARRLAGAMEGMVEKVNHVLTTNWRPSKISVEELTRFVGNNVREDKVDAIIFQLLDNVLFQGRSFDDSTTHQTRDGSGRYHVKGELILANKAAQLNIYNMLKPILAAGGDAPFVIITPMLRYMAGPCCDSNEHLTNSSELSYVSKCWMAWRT